MCGFWSIRCFSLKTQYQQHNLQSLCNKSFCSSLGSFGSVVHMPEGAQEEISQPLLGSSPKLQQGPRIRDWSWQLAGRRQSRAAPRSWRCARGRTRGTVRPWRGSSAGPTRLHHADSGRRRRGACSGGEREGSISQWARRRNSVEMQSKGEAKADVKRRGKGAFLQGEYAGKRHASTRARDDTAK